MASLTSSVCVFILPVALYLMLSQCPVGVSARRCHSIYKGFAQCLMTLGDSLTDGARQDEDVHGIHSICRLPGILLEDTNYKGQTDASSQNLSISILPSPLRCSSPSGRSWDQFHDCANMAMAGCPEEAAAVWESLRQESKKMQFSGNLYDMCSNRNSQPADSVAPRDLPNQEEINRESLRGQAHPLSSHSHFLFVIPLLFLLSWI